MNHSIGNENTMKLLRYSAIIVIGLCIATLLSFQHEKEHIEIIDKRADVTSEQSDVSDASKNISSTIADGSDAGAVAPEENDVKPQSVLQKAPFMSQAPTGEWGNSLYQDGCEEASMIMAAAWLQSSAMPTITPTSAPTISPTQKSTPAPTQIVPSSILTTQEAKKNIQDITDYITKKFGGFTADTSAHDTEEILREYYALGEHVKTEVVEDISLEELKLALRDDAVILAPMNGQLLHNPNFTGAGPLHHMLLIIGYDADKREFITNDPGTRKGASYRYTEDILYQAIRDYKTGNHNLDTVVHKNVIIVYK